MRKNSQLFYKLSSKPEQVFKCRGEATREASIACRAHSEPQVLMTIRPSGAVIGWQVVCTEPLFDRLDGAFLTLINPR